MSRETVTISKFLSYILRHHPEKFNLPLDANGWANIDDLIRCAPVHKKIPITRDLIDYIVAHDGKGRYSISDDGKRIRANQGHSIAIDLELTPEQPPDILYHGTAERFLVSIKAKGLDKGKRHHVHLSVDEETATDVGKRYGAPAVLIIDTGKMHRDGFTFYKSKNRIWLIEHVPVEYITFPA